MKKIIPQKSTLSSADITLLINGMKLIFPTRDEIESIIDERLDAKIKFLPTKDDFYTRMDKLSGEIQKVRDEQDLHTGQHRTISDRLEKAEKQLQVS